MSVIHESRQERLDRLLGTGPAAAQPHQGGVDDDPVQPGSQAALTLELRQTAERQQEGLLDRVPSLFVAAQHAPRDGEHAAAMAFDQLFVGARVAAAQRSEQRGLVRCGSLLRLQISP